MRLEVVHSTRFSYSSTIAETVMELRVRPLDGMGQECLDFDLKITPRSYVGQYRDGFGNHVHYFNHMPAHERIVVVSRSVVETAGRKAAPSEEAYPEEYLGFRPPVVDVAGIRRLASRTPPRATADDAVDGALSALATRIHDGFEYRPKATSVHTTVADVIKLRAGVCQDFAHLFVAAARHMGVPCRYVSGYLAPGNGRVGVGASHAWAEALVPGRGWQGYDPTNPVMAGEDHVRVAVGRDYHDVPPTRGVYLGAAEEDLDVTVETRVLDPGA